MSYMDNGTWTPIWNIATRKNNGNLYWLSVDFGKAVNEAVFLFSTKVGAGLCCTNRLMVRVPLSPDGLIRWPQ